MSRYLTVITAAECGSLTRAAQELGYTQPSLGYIINHIEEDLGVKLFFRDQRGVVLTDAGQKLLEIMKQIESLEDSLLQTALACKGSLLRVGVFPSVSSQWLPQVLTRFYQQHPYATVHLEHQIFYLDGEIGVKQHRLDCSFYTGKCPPGLDIVPLYKDPYYVVVCKDNPLAQRTSLSVQALEGLFPFIPTTESFDPGSAQRDLFQRLERNNRLDFQPQENRAAISMVAQDLGITVLPRLILSDIIPQQNVTLIPLEEPLFRDVSLLCPREAERSPLTTTFLELLQEQVALWQDAQTGGSHETRPD